MKVDDCLAEALMCTVLHGYFSTITNLLVNFQFGSGMNSFIRSWEVLLLLKFIRQMWWTNLLPSNVYVLLHSRFKMKLMNVQVSIIVLNVQTWQRPKVFRDLETSWIFLIDVRSNKNKLRMVLVSESRHRRSFDEATHASIIVSDSLEPVTQSESKKIVWIKNNMKYIVTEDVGCLLTLQHLSVPILCLVRCLHIMIVVLHSVVRTALSKNLLFL